VQRSTITATITVSAADTAMRMQRVSMGYFFGTV
jgi:hypothetical protein